MIIEIENLSKTYKKNLKPIHALKDISFSIPQNQILGILGPNGAGKTTLLKILTGITNPDKKKFLLKILGTQNIDTVKHAVGFLPENPEFLKNISPYELLAFTLRIAGVPFSTALIDQTLEQVNLLKEKNEKVKTFSKGMRQRVGIAQAIIHNPQLLILDEPMSGLDPPGRRMVKDIIDHYHKQGRTVLFSTHNLDDIETLCTHVIVLTHGQIQLQKSLSELRRHSTYKIETEGQIEDGIHKQTLEAQDETALWQHLDHIKTKNQKIIKIQSGIAGQLEKYYDH